MQHESNKEVDVLVLQLECEAEWEKFYKRMLEHNQQISLVKESLYVGFKSGYATGVANAYAEQTRRFQKEIEKLKTDDREDEPS